jgi:hypothetical protein
MKPPFLAACGALTIAGTMSLAAQTPTQPPAPRPQPPAPTQPTRPDSSTVTVTGCLKPWDNTMGTVPNDAPARSGATPMPGTRYVLTDVAPDTRAPGQPGAQPGTPMPPAPAGPPAHPQTAQYIVMAGTGVNLAAHVNHKVTISGTTEHMAPAMAPGTPPAARPGDPAPATSTQPPAKADKAWSTLTATSLTMVSTSCTTQS